MPPFTLLPLRYPLLSLSLPFLRSFSTPASSSRFNTRCTRFLVRQPSPAASRECPTPVVFVRAVGLGEEEEEWANWSGMFAEKGYTSVEIDITSDTSPKPKLVWPSPSNPNPSEPENTSSPTDFDPSSANETPIPEMVAHLSSQIRLMAIPFPPILVASGTTCLLTQAYIEDNPASGLVMLNPPPDQDPRPAKEVAWKWPVFSYEPRFPILVLTDDKGKQGLQGRSRILSAAEKGTGRGGKGVSVEMLVDGERGEKSRVATERWMDRCGY